MVRCHLTVCCVRSYLFVVLKWDGSKMEKKKIPLHGIRFGRHIIHPFHFQLIQRMANYVNYTYHKTHSAWNDNSFELLLWRCRYSLDRCPLQQYRMQVNVILICMHQMEGDPKLLSYCVRVCSSSCVISLGVFSSRYCFSDTWYFAVGEFCFSW